MTRIYYAKDTQERFSHHLVGDGVDLYIGWNGEVLEERTIQYNYASLVEVDILSLVVAGSYVEIAYQVNGTFTKQRLFSSLPSIVKQINELPNVLLAASRIITKENGGCKQYVWAFPQGMLRPNQIQ